MGNVVNIQYMDAMGTINGFKWSYGAPINGRKYMGDWGYKL